jgi:hypothetical protein
MICCHTEYLYRVHGHDLLSHRIFYSMHRYDLLSRGILYGVHRHDLLSQRMLCCHLESGKIFSASRFIIYCPVVCYCNTLSLRVSFEHRLQPGVAPSFISCKLTAYCAWFQASAYRLFAARFSTAFKETFCGTVVVQWDVYFLCPSNILFLAKF